MRSLIVLSLMSASLCLSQLPAQIPADWGVVSAIETTTSPKGSQGGLAAFDPRTPNTLRPITALPAALRSQLCGPGTGQPIGSNCVLVQPSTGDLVVGELATGPKVTCDIHVLPLTGLAVVPAGVKTHTLSNGAGSVDQMAWLPDGRIVFVYKAVTRTGWPFWGGVGILDLKTGLFSQVGITNWPAPTIATKRIGNSIAASADGKTLYFGMFYMQSNVLRGELYSLPCSGGPLTLIASLPGHMPALQMDNDGQVLVATGSAIVRVHPTTRVVTPVTTMMNNAIEVDRLTGNYMVGGQFGTAFGVHTVNLAGATTSTVTNFPTTGCLASVRSGGLSSIAMRNAVEMYDLDSPGINRYSWDMHATGNPRIAKPFPRIGTTFPLVVTSAPGIAPGVIVLGAGRTNLKLGLCFNLLTWPVVVLPPMAPAKTMRFPLTIPMRPTLIGVIFNAQSIHLGTTGCLRATRGLQVIIIP